MSQETGTPRPSAKSWLEDRLAAIEAVYRRFGREGLKDQPLDDVALLLSSKELAYRDAPKGRDLAEEQKAANRQLELEIKDLAGFVNAQLAGAGLFPSRSPRFYGSSAQPDQQKPKPKNRDIEPER